MEPARLLTPARLFGIGAVLAIGLIAPLVLPAYQSQLTELLLFIVFALAWDLVGGQMGYNSFGNVLFVGIGMYASAIVQVGLFYDVGLYNEAKGGGTQFVFDTAQFLTGLGVGLVAAAFAAALIAWLLGSLVLGIRGHYFAICTLGLGIAAGQLAAGIPWIGAGSGMLTPNPCGRPRRRRLAALLSCPCARALLRRDLRLAFIHAFRPRPQRHQG